MERRFLFEDGHDDNHDHFHHDHSDHDHSDHNHNHNHDHDFNPSNTNEALADIQHSLRGSELRMGKRRRVQGASYGYWVDVYVEIDHALCSSNLDVCFWEVGPRTVNYSELGVQFHRSGYHSSLLNLNQSFVFFFFNLRIQ